jgi:hypothetical protein
VGLFFNPCHHTGKALHYSQYILYSVYTNILLISDLSLLQGEFPTQTQPSGYSTHSLAVRQPAYYKLRFTSITCSFRLHHSTLINHYIKIYKLLTLQDMIKNKVRCTVYIISEVYISSHVGLSNISSITVQMQIRAFWYVAPCSPIRVHRLPDDVGSTQL